MKAVSKNNFRSTKCMFKKKFYLRRLPGTLGDTTQAC